MTTVKRQKNDPKNKFPKKELFSSESTPELQNTGQTSKKTKTSNTIGLKGILNLGQSIEIGKKAENLQSWGKEFFGSISHLQKEGQTLFNQKQEQLKKELTQLRAEIQNLAKATKELKKGVQVATELPITQANEYQLNFLSRLKIFIANFRKNISEAGNWLEMFNARSKNRGKFWGNVKKGGQQYMFSSEHGIARSIG